MIQVYKSDIVDLLRSDDKAAGMLEIEYDENNVARVLGATVVEHSNLAERGADALIKIFDRGLDNRLMRSTDVNETSSRSHLLFEMELDSVSQGVRRQGKLLIVDLAGSERVACIHIEEPLYEEALFINESLKYLGYLIRCLAADHDHAALNFNLNRVTSLLSDYIGGNSQTLMFICISPSEFDLEATQDSLKFAEETGRVKNYQGEISKDAFALALKAQNKLDFEKFKAEAIGFDSLLESEKMLCNARPKQLKTVTVPNLDTLK